jgi:hypothetical protein
MNVIEVRFRSKLLKHVVELVHYGVH